MEFYDFKNVSGSKKVLHHFRTKTLAEELNYVKKCWEEICLSNPNILIPAYKIKDEDKINDKKKIVFLKTLKKIFSFFKIVFKF